MNTRRTILIADDQVHFTDSMQAALAGSGHEVVIARNRAQAQRAVATRRPDVVVLGTIMPQGDPFRFHEWMKETPEFSDIPLIVVDAPPEERFIRGWRMGEGMTMDAEDFLSKPVEPAALAQRVERQLDRARKRISVLVVDDHAIVRDGIRALLGLQRDIQVVGEATDGWEALEKTRALHPDVVLMDIVMPVMDGLEATRKISGEHPRTKVLMLTQYDDEENMSASAGAGAFGFIPKKLASSQLLTCIRSANQGVPFNFAGAA
jgi:DNA-binding NarL/FixJ family response regulator